MCTYVCMLYNSIMCNDMQIYVVLLNLYARGDYLTCNLPSLDIHSPEAAATNIFKHRYLTFTRELGHWQRNARKNISLVKGVTFKIFELTLVNYTITSTLA